MPTTRRACTILALLAVMSVSSHAESDLQKFQAAAPSDLKLEFSQYQSCALQVLDENRHAGASFEHAETEIAKACKKFLPIKPPASSATLPTERSRLIQEFARLAREERRYLYAGQYPPGYKRDPWVERTLACTRTQEVMDEIHKCFVEQGRPLIQLSKERPEIIAIAVAAACRAPQQRLETILAGCMSWAEAQKLLELYVGPLRDAVISAVVQRRALQPENPMPPPPAAITPYRPPNAEPI